MSDPLPLPEHLKSHHLFSGKPYGIVTAQNPVAPVTSPGGNDALEQRFKKEGLKYEPVNGNYGHDEQSYVVYHPTLPQMHAIGKDFGQESVVYGEGGQHQIHYTTGPNAGHYHPTVPGQDINYFASKPEKYWTEIPGGKGFFNINVDWNTKHPAQPPKTMKHYDMALDLQKAWPNDEKGAVVPQAPQHQAVIHSVTKIKKPKTAKVVTSRVFHTVLQSLPQPALAPIAKNLPMAPITAPALHSTVEGFMGGLKTLPKGSPARGKMITQHMNHGPFLSALKAHPQGAQVHTMLMTHLNSQANAGFKPGGAVATVKSEPKWDDLIKAIKP